MYVSVGMTLGKLEFSPETIKQQDIVKYTAFGNYFTTNEIVFGSNVSGEFKVNSLKTDIKAECSFQVNHWEFEYRLKLAVT